MGTVDLVVNSIATAHLNRLLKNLILVELDSLTEIVSICNFQHAEVELKKKKVS